MIRWMLALSMMSLSACSAAFKAPKAAYSEVGKLEANGYEVTSAYNTSIFRWPGLTWSISGTYLPGARGKALPDAPEFSFRQRGGGRFGLEVAAPEGCRSSPSANQQLAVALSTLWNDVGGLPSDGVAKVSIVDRDTYFTRYNISLHAGRTYELRYWTPCINDNGDTALYYGALIALHESTHASLTIVGAESNSERARERVAVGASACLYLGLRQGDKDFSRQQQSLLDVFRQAAGLRDKSVDLTEICESWKTQVRAASARSSR